MIPLEILTMVENRPIPPVRHSTMTTYEECPRKFFYKHRLGLTPRGAYSSALGIGDFLHQLMRRLIQGVAQPTAFLQVEAVVEKFKTDFAASLGSGVTLTGPATSEIIQSVDEDFAKAKAMASVTMSLHPLNLTDYNVIAVEKTLDTTYWPYPEYPKLQTFLRPVECPSKVSPGCLWPDRFQRSLSTHWGTNE